MEIESKSDELQKAFQRDINCLTEEVNWELRKDRGLRLKGLTAILNSFFKAEFSNDEKIIVFERAILKYFKRVIDDSIEKHRRMSIEILEK